MRSFSSVSIVLFFFVFFFFFKIILFQGEERLLFPWNPFALFHHAFQSLQLIIVIILVRRGIGAFYLVTSRSRGIYQSHEHVFRSCSYSSLSRYNRHFCAAKKCGKKISQLSNEEEEVIKKKTTKKSRSERETKNSFVLLLFLVFLFYRFIALSLSSKDDKTTPPLR